MSHGVDYEWCIFTPIPQASPRNNLLLSPAFQNPRSHSLSSRGLNINTHPSILFALPQACNRSAIWKALGSRDAYSQITSAALAAV